MTDSERPRARAKRQRGAIAQVVLFTTVWSTLVSVFGLVAVAPVLLEAGRTGQSAEELLGVLSAASTTTLGMTAATALGTVLSVWVMWRWFDGPALLDLGLRPRRGWLADSLVGLGLGPAMFGLMLALLLLVGWVQVTGGSISASQLAVALLTYLLVALSEEVFARGWILQVLERGRGRVWAVVGSSAIFSILHGANPNITLMALVGLFLAGLLFAQAYLMTRQLWLPIALHLSWNFSEGPIFGFPVSGMASQGLLTVTPTGPEVMTGGAFGPEAGAVVIVGMVLASAVIAGLARTRPQRPQAEWQTDAPDTVRDAADSA
ncbi:MAG: CPBP family intramembrane metalloprotease [Chloroflexi bacterium]|nr:CPBP family intramembrane metalloprotease [Chloroflexota bacterium]